jgi:hypothetical protein
LEVRPEQVRGAISALSMLTPVGDADGDSIGKPMFGEGGQLPLTEMV